MAPINNVSAIFNEIPQGSLTDKAVITKVESIDLDTVQLSGGILVKMLYLSVEPYLRAMMRPPSARADIPAYTIGAPIFGFAIATVLRSEKPGINAGDNLYVSNCSKLAHSEQLSVLIQFLSPAFQQYAVLPADHPIRVVPNDPEVPLSAYIGFLGMPGMTAFYGLELVGKPKKGETLYVSSGAGPVGSLVAQLAKLKGLKVIASAGTDDKVEFMKSIGVDVPFNYKTENMKEILAKEGPIDVYWDNVGGSTLEAALEACNARARVVVCGAMSAYNSAGEPYGVKTTTHILFKRLTIQGYMVSDGEPEYEGQMGNPVRFLAAITPLVNV
ncbi:hypothetical protein FRC08_001054 [Ceratobasidium sp. 394]|nr:hypothetical protein FRC08_001054 [Ceratobasidium sp. 394]